jgi:hypothetical protein
LLDIEDETCIIALSSESINFRSTVIKSFLIESINDVESSNKNVQSIEDVQSSDHRNNLSDESLEITRSFAISRSFAITRPTRARRLSLRYQNVVDITVFLQDEDPHSNQFENAFIFLQDKDPHSNQFEDVLTSTSIPTFENSRRKEINDLLKRRVFELIIIENVSRDVRIFNFRFLDEIKHSRTSNAYEKLRLMIQTYNDQDKTLIFTQFLTIQKMSQRIIHVLTTCTSDCHLYLRDITQAYVQSKTPLNREFFIRSSRELNLSKNSILRVVKSLYQILIRRV